MGGGNVWTSAIATLGLGVDGGQESAPAARARENNASAAAEADYKTKLNASKALNLSLINKEKGTTQRVAGSSRAKELAALAFSSKQQVSQIPLGGSSIFEEELGKAVDTSKGKKGALGV